MASLNEFLKDWRSEDPYIIAHTSGSTGTPKNIRLPKADMEASAKATNKFFGINGDSLLGIPLSFDYIAAKMMAVRAEIAQCAILELEPKRDIHLPDDDSVIDLLSVVPLNIDSLLSQPSYPHRIRNLLIGGAAPSVSQCRSLVAAGYQAYISYGMTETCSHVALAEVNDPLRIYHGMPGIEFDVDTDSRLIIKAPAYSFGILQTNDVVELLDNTSFRWRGRADGVINSGGIKLFPEELENLYRPFLEDINFYVCGADDSTWGTAVVLVFEGLESQESRIRDILSLNVSDHRRLPKRIIAVPSLPRTSNGKVRRIVPSDI